ncbi:MAG: hypothetical protein RLZ25_1184 [Pseudomonadota bacterium]|jgi:uncharacterized protein (TIGR00255 family)
MPYVAYATHSMTGFATRKTKWNDWEVVWELKSVNNRFLDASVRLPEWLRSLETEMRSIITKKIRRGRVDATLTMKRLGETGTGLSVNHEALKGLTETLYEIHNVKGLQISPPTSLDLLKWPGIVIEAEIDREALSQILIHLLQDSLEDLVISRKTEGAAIAALIAQRCEQIQNEVNGAKKRMPEVMRLVRERLIGKAQELSQNLDQDRLEQEILFYAQKLDVAEELDRLELHLVEMDRSLKNPEPIGRRLDFLTQELNREANTLGSKSQDAEMTRCSVDIKVLIEQIKEQVQNIE